MMTDNDQLQKQLRLVRSKKNTAQKQKSRPVKQLDEQQKKEVFTSRFALHSLAHSLPLI